MKLTDKRLNAVRAWLSYPGSVVYFIGPKRGDLVKIGYAADLVSRLRHLQTGSPVKLEVLAAIAGGLDLERTYHRQFAAHRLHGEWFTPHPDILAEIERLSV